MNKFVVPRQQTTRKCGVMALMVVGAAEVVVNPAEIPVYVFVWVERRKLWMEWG